MQEDIKFILNLIQEQGFQAYVVGGYVRDFYLLNVHNKDIDISTNCDSDKLLSIFSAFNPTMLKYETIKFKFGQFNVDIAQFRDEQYDGTKTIVKLANSLEIDAKRRDFTINSLYMDVDGKLIDFYNGLEDLNNHKLRFI
ncbi:MAG: hypothetical protein K6G37_00950, partial [Bacilli bacterium]|nr:hypothetical protein [Bacilli bacterium]